MSEEIKTEAEAPKRKGGWPAGKPRKPVAQATAETRTAPAPARPSAPALKMKAKPNWDDDTWETVGADQADRLNIPKDIVERLARDGIALQWVTRQVRGMEAPLETAKFTKGGWTPVHQSDFDGILDGLFMGKGIDEVITLEDCMLMARPMGLQEKSIGRMKREAIAPVQVTEQAIGHGIPGVTGSDHITAIRGNAIKKSVVQIPD